MYLRNSVTYLLAFRVLNILDNFSKLFRELSKRKINDLQITWSRKK
jgi:hypothetical protein